MTKAADAAATVYVYSRHTHAYGGSAGGFVRLSARGRIRGFRRVATTLDVSTVKVLGDFFFKHSRFKKIKSLRN